MQNFTSINLTELPAPDIVESLDYKTVLAQMKQSLKDRLPEYSAGLLESDPAIKILEVAAYREVLLRQRINDAARAVMLVSARGADLDNLGAIFGVKRFVIDAGDKQAIPPIPPSFEDDERFRQRIQLAPESYTTAGSVGSYVFHVLSSSPMVKDVDVVSPNPGEVLVTILANEADGVADDELLDVVTSYIKADERRPLTDLVRVEAANIIHYQIEAELELYNGPDSNVVLAQARDKLNKYVSSQHRLGEPVTIAGIHAALFISGITRKVKLIAPASDITTSHNEAAFCDNINIYG